MLRSLQRDIKYTRDRDILNILKRRDSIFIGNWISVKMKCFIKLQFLVRFCVGPFIIFVYADDDSKILRNTSFISRNINIICSKVVSEIANIVSIIKSECLFRPVLKVFSEICL
jgi:hypothetical protein